MTDVPAGVTRDRHIELVRIALGLAEQLKGLTAIETAVILDTIEDLPIK